MRYLVVYTWRPSFMLTKYRPRPSFHQILIQIRNFNIIQYPTMPKPTSRQNSYKNDRITQQPYQYEPLSSSQSSIRLLRLHPSPDRSWPIRCTLFHSTLEEAPPYVALSYAWGDAAGPSLILVGTETVSVTRNLRHALLRLRPRSGEEDLVMWVDAICINQEDIPERNFQTANMRAIYQHAASVDVWLGLEKYGSVGAIELARDLNSCGTREEVISVLDRPETREHLVFLVTLFRRQYWWRIWVIQEVSCAKTAMIYCGDEAIPWTTLDNVCDILKTVEPQLRSLFYTHPSYIRTLTHGGPRGLQLSRYSPHLSAPPLLELLLSHKSKKSTDPKDKVYALVGISSSRHTFGKIDYSLSMREIYTHTARHIITTSQKLDVICVKQHDVDQFSLPSVWTPGFLKLFVTSPEILLSSSYALLIHPTGAAFTHSAPFTPKTL